jgi:hypothetical protein
MSIKSKIAAIVAASLGMVLTQSSAPRAETDDNSAPEKATKIAAPIDLDEIFYTALPDEVLERAAASGSPTAHCNTGDSCTANCATYVVGGCITQPVKKPSLGASPKGSTGPTVPPKPAQGIKNK